MKNNEYIHINEAVNVYNKTRQTFYNYIKRGLIASKKINNKVYLKIEDIEKIISDYIHINDSHVLSPSTHGEIIDPDGYQMEYDKLITEAEQEEQEEQKNKNNVFQENIQKDLLRLHKQYYTLKDDLIHEVKRSNQEILFDTKAMNYNQEQRIINNISQQFKEIRQQKKELNKKISLLSLRNRKISFWV